MPAAAPETTVDSSAVHRPDIVTRQRVRMTPRPLLVIDAPGPVEAAGPATPRASADEGAPPTGYRQPPVHTRFRKGASGNPRGRPKGAKGIKTMVRSLLTEKISVRASGRVIRMTRMEAALRKITEAAMSGQPRALQQLVSLYSAAVPDEPVRTQGSDISPASAPADIDQHDQAILESLRAMLLAETRGLP